MALANQIIIEIVNIISKTSVAGPLDISSLNEKISRISNSDFLVEYNREEYPAMILRFRRPKATVSIFGSGAIVCTSTRSITQSNEILENVKSILRECEIKIASFDVKIENIVASVNLGKRVNLVKFSKSIPKTMYEPEQFPAVIFRTNEPPIATFLIYNNGRLICTGCKKEVDIFVAVRRLNVMLEKKQIFT